MSKMRGMLDEIRDVTAGLWLWRVRHPDWRPGLDWEPLVTSTCVESRGEVALLDPIAPPDDAKALWDRLDARPPTLLIVLKPDHVRDVDLFARRYGARAFGPYLFWRDDIPETDLEPIDPGSRFLVISSLCMTAGAATRHRFGCPNNAHWFLPTR